MDKNITSVITKKNIIEHFPQILASDHIQKILNISLEEAHEIMKQLPFFFVLRRPYVLKKDFINWLNQF